jgi:nuclear cap-binding protein subunit 1
VYEINRKEAAAILLQIPKWMASGTFAPQLAPGEEADESASKWILENIVVEVR